MVSHIFLLYPRHACTGPTKKESLANDDSRKNLIFPNSGILTRSGAALPRSLHLGLLQGNIVVLVGATRHVMSFGLVPPRVGISCPMLQYRKYLYVGQIEFQSSVSRCPSPPRRNQILPGVPCLWHETIEPASHVSTRPGKGGLPVVEYNANSLQ
jgi:hypothetical protein